MSKKDSNIIDQIESFLNDLLVKKAPALPANLKEILAKITPWLLILGLILGLPSILLLLGISAALPHMMYIGLPGYASGIGIVAIAATIVNIIFQIISLPGLFKRKYQGWRYLYFATLASFISVIVVFDLGNLIMEAIAFYLLFQIREKYKQ